MMRHKNFLKIFIYFILFLQFAFFYIFAAATFFYTRIAKLVCRQGLNKDCKCMARDKGSSIFGSRKILLLRFESIEIFFYKFCGLQLFYCKENKIQKDGTPVL